MTHKNRVPHLEYEQRLWAAGYRSVAGLDEAGRGAWAGPVVAAAVILPPDMPDLFQHLSEVRDSKMVGPAKRRLLVDVIRRHAVAMGVGVVPATEIDRHGIVSATRTAMAWALQHLNRPVDRSPGPARCGLAPTQPTQRRCHRPVDCLCLDPRQGHTRSDDDRPRRPASRLRVCPTQRLWHGPTSRGARKPGPVPHPSHVLLPPVPAALHPAGLSSTKGSQTRLQRARPERYVENHVRANCKNRATTGSAIRSGR